MCVNPDVVDEIVDQFGALLRGEGVKHLAGESGREASEEEYAVGRMSGGDDTGCAERVERSEFLPELSDFGSIGQE